MGMAGADIALLSGILGSSLIGGVTAPEGQELSSFEGRGGIDPAVMMGESKDLIAQLISSLTDRANEDITLKTTVNPNPSFAGGALPMAIGTTGMDPRRLNPSLRTTTATAPIGKRSLTPGSPAFQDTGTGSLPGGVNNPGNSNPDADPRRTPWGAFTPPEVGPNGQSYGSSAMAPRRLTFGGSGSPGGDDMQKAQAALQLLMKGAV